MDNVLVCNWCGAKMRVKPATLKIVKELKCVKCRKMVQVPVEMKQAAKEGTLMAAPKTEAKLEKKASDNGDKADKKPMADRKRVTLEATHLKKVAKPLPEEVEKNDPSPSRVFRPRILKVTDDDCDEPKEKPKKPVVKKIVPVVVSKPDDKKDVKKASPVKKIVPVVVAEADEKESSGEAHRPKRIFSGDAPTSDKKPIVVKPATPVPPAGVDESSKPKSKALPPKRILRDDEPDDEPPAKPSIKNPHKRVVKVSKSASSKPSIKVSARHSSGSASKPTSTKSACRTQKSEVRSKSDSKSRGGSSLNKAAGRGRDLAKKKMVKVGGKSANKVARKPSAVERFDPPPPAPDPDQLYPVALPALAPAAAESPAAEVSKTPVAVPAGRLMVSVDISGLEERIIALEEAVRKIDARVEFLIRAENRAAREWIDALDKT